MLTYSFYLSDPRVRREAETLVKAGHSVDVISLRRGNEPAKETVNGVRIIRMPLGKRRGGAARYLIEYTAAIGMTALYFTWYHLRNRYRLVQVHTPPDGLVLSALAAKMTGAAILHDLHDPMPEAMLTKFGSKVPSLLNWMVLLQEKIATRLADRIVTVTDQVRDALVERGVPARKVAIVMNFADRTIVKPDSGALPERGVKPAKWPVLVYMGTLTRQYGVDVAIDAVALLREQYPGIQLRVIGDGEERDPLEAQAKALGVSDAVTFHGVVPINDIPGVALPADVGLAPHRRDRLYDMCFPQKVYDYLSLGLPVVAGRTDSLEYYYGHQTLQLFESGNAADLARAIALVVEDSSRRAVMRDLAKDFLASHSWQHESRTYVAVVNELLKQPPAETFPASTAPEVYGGEHHLPERDSEATATSLRILFLNHNVAEFGGTYFRAFDVARHLVRRGHRVTLLTISEKARWSTESEFIEGVEIVRTPDLFWGIGRSGWDPWDTLVRIGLVRRREWDLIHAWDCRPAVIFPALAARFRKRRPRPKLIIDWCDWWGRGGTQLERGGSWIRHVYNAIETVFEEAFRKYADGTTVISRTLFKRAAALGVDPKTTLLLAQGCDLAAPPLPQDREAARRELDIPLDVPVFATLGVLNTRDAEVLFQTIRIVRKTLPHCRFYVIGKNRAEIPPDLEPPLLRAIGYVHDDLVTTYLAAADALVVPLADTLSNQARWPSKVNFALKRAVPVVITRVGDLPRFLEREGAAFVSDPNPRALADSLVRVVTRPAFIEETRRAAARVATTVLPWPRIVERLESFYAHIEAAT
jgi:glycosyltransferase involved in cell wall biosynthesis